jgi:hypothetical protein
MTRTALLITILAAIPAYAQDGVINPEDQFRRALVEPTSLTDTSVVEPTSLDAVAKPLEAVTRSLDEMIASTGSPLTREATVTGDIPTRSAGGASTAGKPIRSAGSPISGRKALDSAVVRAR